MRSLLALALLLCLPIASSLPALSPADVMVRTATVGCKGDCTLCNCPPERTLAHTCCCWQKKSRTFVDHGGNCCQKDRHSAEPIITCTPCGSDDRVAFGDEAGDDLLPSCHDGSSAFHEITHVKAKHSDLAQQADEPLEPPPKEPSHT